MPDAPTPLDLDAIETAIAACRTYNFGMYQADRLAHEHAPALVEEVKRLRAEVATERAEVTRLRTIVGDCHCDKNPETTNGPEEDCPQHGRPVAEVWDIVKGAEAGWDRARAEVERLCAEARIANASAYSAGLALGARLDHPHGGTSDLADRAPSDETVRAALTDARAALPHLTAAPSATRDEVRDEIAGHPIGSGYYATSVGVDEASEIADALLARFTITPKEDR